MRSAEGQLQRIAAREVRRGEVRVATIGIDLHRAVEAVEDFCGIFAFSLYAQSGIERPCQLAQSRSSRDRRVKPPRDSQSWSCRLELRSARVNNSHTRNHACIDKARLNRPGLLLVDERHLLARLPQLKAAPDADDVRTIILTLLMAQSISEKAISGTAWYSDHRALLESRKRLYRRLAPGPQAIDLVQEPRQSCQATGFSRARG